MRFFNLRFSSLFFIITACLFGVTPGLAQIKRLKTSKMDTSRVRAMKVQKEHKNNASQNLKIDSFERKTFNIYFWELRNDDGSGHPTLNRENAFKANKDLNAAFNDFNICFNLVGYDTIRNSDFERTSPFKLRKIVKYAKAHGKYKENALNVYLFSFTRSAGIQKKSALGVGKFQFRDDPGSQILIHEMGHYFGLSHPHSGWRGSYCEHVSRHKKDSTYNANVKGDRIADTGAIPNFVKEQLIYGTEALDEIGYSYKEAKKVLQHKKPIKKQRDSAKIIKALSDYGFTDKEIDSIAKNGVQPNAYVDFETCRYTGEVRPDSPMFKDCQGTPYRVSKADVKNYMTNSYKPCQTRFTKDQKLKMLQTIKDSHPDNPMTKAIN